MSGRRIGMLFGGRSVEHEVSVDSARSVATALTAAGFELVPIGVTGEGRWLSPEASARVLAGDAVRVEDDGADRLVVDPGSPGLLRVGDGTLKPVPLDAVFPLIHGWGGEDGRLQGALELSGIPYVGSGVLASALAMDKVQSRRLLDSAGVPSVRWRSCALGEWRAGGESKRRIVDELGWPLFVKPANGGSSVGISRVAGPEGLEAAVEQAGACDATLVFEEGLDAREIECAVIGNARPEASVLGEVHPSREFYDYDAKYVDGTSVLTIPAELDPETARSIRELACRAHRLLGLAGLARVDFLVERSGGRICLNEVNTLPGFTAISMFPKLWEASGLPSAALVRRLVDLAFERRDAEAGRRARWQEE